MFSMSRLLLNRYSRYSVQEPASRILDFGKPKQGSISPDSAQGTSSAALRTLHGSSRESYIFRCSERTSSV